jgi:hypothetical protein
MARPKQRYSYTKPDNAQEVTTYAGLGRLMKQFADGKRGFLVIWGRPGNGKSMMIQAAIQGTTARYHRGVLSALELHVDGYEYLGANQILDDCLESVLACDNGLGTLLVFAETTGIKRPEWRSRYARREKIKPFYHTTANLCVVSNKFWLPDALLSRATSIVYFNPSDEEIHRQVATWFHNQPIHDWVGRHLTRIQELDVRWYKQAFENYINGEDWRRIFLDTYGLDPHAAVVQNLYNNPAFPTAPDRVREFGRLTGQSRSTYFDLRKHLMREGKLDIAAEIVAPIRVQGTEPRQYTLADLKALNETGRLPPPPEPPTPRAAITSGPITGTGTGTTPSHRPDRPARTLDDSMNPSMEATLANPSPEAHLQPDDEEGEE